jgi:AraC-like DNA-binding protein/mannose-6-phosphate isomerase-like protein (cupin superfamily)
MYDFPDQDFPQLTHFGFSDQEGNLSLHPHRHLGFEVVYFTGGNATVRVMPGKEAVEVGAEDAIITAPGVLHGFELNNRGTAFYWLGFQAGPTIGRAASSTLEEPRLLGKPRGRASPRLRAAAAPLYFEDPRFSLSPFLERIDVQDFRVVRPVPEAGFLFRRIEDEIRSDRPFRRSIIHLSILELLAYIERRMAAPMDALERVRAYLDSRIENLPTLADTAAYAGLDKAYLCRIFKARYGLAPMAYARRARLEEAKRHLADGASVADAGRRAGYSVAQRFCAAFRAAYGISPGEYASRAYSLSREA